jgi:zinc protease
VKRLAFAALASLALVGSAPAGKSAATQPAIKLPAVERFELDNGLQVAFMHVDTAPVVSVQVWYHVGSKDEPANRRGSAHMFEHIMFKGSEHVKPEEHARLINEIGGYVNAHTTEDATVFHQTLPADYMDFALELEGERMRHLLFRDDMIATEKEVVKEEIRRDHDNPVAMGFLRFLEIAYTKHPYAWTAGGDIKDLDATTPDDLKKFYDTYYQPGNALVVIVGNVSLDDVKKSVQAHFGEIAKAAAPPRPAAAKVEPAQTAKRREVSDPSQLGLVLVGWHIPEAKHADIYALQVLSLILGEGESSRLRQRIKQVDKKTKHAHGVEAGSQALVREDPGLFAAVGVFLTAGAEDQVEAALFDEVAKITTKGATAAELRKSKNQIQAGFVFGLESADGLANQIGQSWILTGDPTQWLRDLEQFEKVSLEDLQRVAKTYLTADKSTVVVIPPASKE